MKDHIETVCGILEELGFSGAIEGVEFFGDYKSLTCWPDTGLVICTWNRPEFVEQSFASVQESDLDGCLVIVVDDHSGDDKTLELVQGFSLTVPLIKIYKASRSNVNVSLDIGWSLAEKLGCKKLLNLDSDAIVKQNWLVTLNQLFEKLDRPDNHLIVSGFNRHNNPCIVSTFEDHVIKSKMGGINYYFDVSLFKKVKPFLQTVNWDSALQDAFWEHRALQYTMAATKPSVVQHIGTYGLNAHVTFDYALDFDESEKKQSASRTLQRPDNQGSTPKKSADSKTLILLYNRFYDRDFRKDFKTHEVGVSNARFTEDRNMLAKADAVVFHIPGLIQAKEKLPKKPANQLWVSWSVESDVYYPVMNHQNFDIKMTYKRSADIWTPYLASYAATFEADIRSARFPKKSDCIVASFVSNGHDKSGRAEYLSELSKYISVHHYGRFLNNQQLEHDLGRETKLETFRRYKFAIAFENSISHDYVTEKFFDPFLTGTIPVYLGAPNIEEYAPADDSFINVNDFKDPKDLAGFIQSVQNSENAYKKYLDWKNRPLKPDFIELLSRINSAEPQFVQLVKLVKRYMASKKAIKFRQSTEWQLVKDHDLYYLENPTLEKLYNINISGAVVWQMLDDFKSVKQICDFLAHKYAKPVDDFYQDVSQLVWQLYGENILIRSWIPGK